MWIRTCCKNYDSELVNLDNIVQIHKRKHYRDIHGGADIEATEQWKIIAVDNSSVEGGGTYTLASQLTQKQADYVLREIFLTASSGKYLDLAELVA